MPTDRTFDVSPQRWWRLVACGALFAAAGAGVANEVTPLRVSTAAIQQSIPLNQAIPLHNPNDGPTMFWLAVVSELPTEELTVSGSQPVQRCQAPLLFFGRPALLLTVEGRGTREVTVKAKPFKSVPPTVSLTLTPVSMTDQPSVAAYRALSGACELYAAFVGADDSSATAARPRLSRIVRQYRDAARLARVANHRTLEANALMQLASISYWDLLEWATSRSLAQSAARLARLQGDLRMATLAELFMAFCETEQAPEVTRDSGTRIVSDNSAAIFQRARQRYARADAFFAARQERWSQAIVRNMWGLSEYFETRYEAATRLFETAAPVFRALGDTVRYAQVLNNQGLVDIETARHPQAVVQFSAAKELLADTGDPQLAADVMNNYALAALNAGDLDTALAGYVDSQQQQSSLQNVSEEARSLHGIGRVYYATGDWETAKHFLSRALTMRPPQKDPRGRGATLGTLASIAMDEGHLPVASQYIDDGLSFTAPGVRRDLLQLRAIELQRRQGQRVAATKTLEALLTRATPIEPSIAARALLLRAHLAHDSQQWSEAESRARTALAALDRLPLPYSSAEALNLLARLQARRAEWARALQSVDQGITLLDTLRLQLRNPEFRVSAELPLRSLFQTQIRIHQAMQAQGVMPASEVSRHLVSVTDRAKARAIEESLGGVATLESVEGVPAARATERLALMDRYSDLLAEWQYRVDRSGSSDARAVTLRDDLTRVKAQIDRVHSLAAPRRAAATMALAADWKRLGPDEVIVSYWLNDGEEPALALVVQSSGPVVVPIGNSQAIREVAIRLAQSVRQPLATDVSPLAAEASERLLRPVHPFLRSKKRVMVVPTDALWMVPFAMLPIPDRADGQLLIDQTDVGFAPSIAFAIAHREPPRVSPNPRVLAVADVVYDEDERLASLPARRVPASSALPTGGARGPLSRLRNSLLDAAVVGRLTTPDRRAVRSGFAASRDQVLTDLAKPFEVIHFSNHALIHAERPMLSALVLSRYDATGQAIRSDIRASDLERLRLQADLVFLAACDTALSHTGRYNGAIGLSSVFLSRGARSVIASQWAASDAFASQLVAAFYRHYGRERDSLRSLSAAIREMRKIPSFTDPYFWAPFVVMVGPGIPPGTTPRRAATSL